MVLQLAGQLTAAYGRGWSAQNLFYMKQFYATYPGLIAAEKILHAVRGELAEGKGVWKPDSQEFELDSLSDIVESGEGPGTGIL